MSDSEYKGLRKLFVFASGARPDILRASPTEETAYATLGGTVITTAALAGTSMAFALSMALSAPLWVVAVAGAIWALAIFNLDRWLITSTRRTTTRIGQIVNALPRLALAVLLGVVISEPLVLRIFESEISDEIELTRQAELRDERDRQEQGPEAERIAANRAEIVSLQSEFETLSNPVPSASQAAATAVDTEITSLRTQISTLQEEMRVANKNWLDALADANEELSVGGVSGRGAGAGENYQLKLDKANSLEVLSNELRAQNETTISAHETRIGSLQQDLDQARIDQADGARARDAQTLTRIETVTSEIERLTADNATIQSQMDASIETLREETSDPGLIAQIEALEALGKRSPSIRTAHYLLAGLFIFIDVLPVLGKLLQLLVKPKPYELMVDAVDRKAAMNAEIFAAEAERERNDRVRELTDDNDLRAAVEIENRRHFIQSAGEMQRRLGDEQLRRWEEQQLAADPSVLDLDLDERIQITNDPSGVT